MGEIIKRKKPNFKRQSWNKKAKLGKSQKKKRKWRVPVGIHSQVRLRKKGYIKRPSIGWGSDKKLRGKVKGLTEVRIENFKQLEKVPKGDGILIAKVGRKLREKIIAEAKKLKITILNRYIVKPNLEAKDATS